MKSVQWKLVVIHIIVVLIVMISSGIFIMWQMENYEYDKVKNELRASVKDMMQIINVDLSDEEVINTIKNHIEKNTLFYNDRDMQIFILDSTGKYLFSTTKLLDEDAERFGTSAIIAAISGEEEFEVYKEVSKQGIERELLAFAKPVKLNESVKEIIYIRIYTDTIKDALNEKRMIIIFAIIIALVITSFIAYFFASTVTEPIKDLTDSARLMARGDLHQRIDVKSNDEIGQLTKSFNYMAFELNKTLAEISSEKNKLESVFSHMKDGLVAFNAAGQIIHANAATYQIVGNNFIGDNFYYFVEKLNIEINFYEILNMQESEIIKHEVHINDRILNVIIVNYLNEKNQPEGVIIMLSDITEQKRLDDMRKEFVANVSHELRTPLTTVKTYAETIIDMGLEDKKMVIDFLKTIESEADRMTMLVQDLLELSRFDNQQIKFKMEKVDIVPILRRVSEQYKMHAKKKNQVLHSKDIKKEIILEIDPLRIIQVLNNIMSNAVKYSNDGDNIYVDIVEKEDVVNIIVKDTGMGIPKEDLPRVFERFYRVDKARSRAMGGTGLGLPIAKEIMEYHGGKITMNSKYGLGTEVIIEFKKCKSNVSSL